MGIGRLFAILWGGLMVSMAGAAVAALSMKRRVIPSASPDADEVTLVAIFEPIALNRGRPASAVAAPSCGMAVGSSTSVTRRWIRPARPSRSNGVRRLPGARPGELAGHDPHGRDRRRRRRAAAHRARSRCPHLTIEGTAFFGGVGVTSDIPAEAERSVREAVAKRAQQVGGGPGVPVMEPETVTT